MRRWSTLNTLEAYENPLPVDIRRAQWPQGGWVVRMAIAAIGLLMLGYLFVPVPYLYYLCFCVEGRRCGHTGKVRTPERPWEPGSPAQTTPGGRAGRGLLPPRQARRGLGYFRASACASGIYHKITW